MGRKRQNEKMWSCENQIGISLGTFFWSRAAFHRPAWIGTALDAEACTGRKFLLFMELLSRARAFWVHGALQALADAACDLHPESIRGFHNGPFVLGMARTRFLDRDRTMVI